MSKSARAYERVHYRRLRRIPAKRWSPFSGQRLLGAGEDLRQVASVFRRLFPEAARACIRQADAICEHVFDLLGSGPVRLSPPGPPYQSIDWHADFKSGHRWSPETPYRDIRYGPEEEVDIKVPWELSRFQHLTILGQAYALTGDDAYVTEFSRQIDDWIGGNPVGFGVNWTCTMDVAVRAANWLTAAEYVHASHVLGPAFFHRFHSSLYEHARFIVRHLERNGPKTNHYLADIVGLLFIAVYCPFFPASRRWRDFCIRELRAEMENQVHADGCHFEASTCYHRLVLELFLFATMLVTADEADSNKESRRQTAERVFGVEYVERLHRMFVAVLHLLKPDGRMPQIGDNDSGRFLALQGREMLDMRYLLPLGALFLDEPLLKVREFGYSEDALWLFGEKGHDTWNGMPGRSLGTIGSMSFPHAGWYVIRHNQDYCLVSCGSGGPDTPRGHAHNDRLSFELMLDGRDVVVDPGTYLYTSCPRIRNTFRSTGGHNTVKIDEYEQSEPLNGDVFRLIDRTTIRLARLTETTGRIRFEGEIEYDPVMHRRTISLDTESRQWTIDDHVSCPGSCRAEVAFHLSPHVTSRGGEILEKGSQTPVASMQIQGGPSEVRTYDYSPRYGVCVQAPCVCVQIPSPADGHITTVFNLRKLIETTSCEYAPL